MGGMITLPHLMRADHLRRLTYTADSILAPQAMEMGLVTELSDDPLQAARDLAAKIALKSPSAIRAAKRLLEFAETSDDEEAVLLKESREQTDLIGKAHQMEVIAANMQKRDPVFK
jgi:enoyl-CoA hydratase/carnithine racemase